MFSNYIHWQWTSQHISQPIKYMHYSTSFFLIRTPLCFQTHKHSAYEGYELMPLFFQTFLHLCASQLCYDPCTHLILGIFEYTKVCSSLRYAELTSFATFFQLNVYLHCFARSLKIYLQRYGPHGFSFCLSA